MDITMNNDLVYCCVLSIGTLLRNGGQFGLTTSEPAQKSSKELRLFLGKIPKLDLF